MWTVSNLGPFSPWSLLGSLCKITKLPTLFQNSYYSSHRERKMFASHVARLSQHGWKNWSCNKEEGKEKGENIPKFFQLDSEIEIQTHVWFHNNMCLKENNFLRFKMWTVHSCGSSPGNAATMLWEAQANGEATGRYCTSLLDLGLQGSSSPQPFQSLSAVWVFPAEVPDIKGQRLHPCLCSQFLTRESVTTIRWLLLHPPSPPEAWCDLLCSKR